jgi:DNA-binding HxlR family transcriptional regulator
MENGNFKSPSPSPFHRASRSLGILKDKFRTPTAKLSKELKSLEEHQLIKRVVYDTVPVTIEYKLTPHAKTLDKVILELRHIASEENPWQVMMRNDLL